MFSRVDTVPNRPTTIAYSYALLAIMFMPYFLCFDRTTPSSNEEASLSREYPVMFARVWLAAAWVNLAVAHCVADCIAILWCLCLLSNSLCALHPLMEQQCSETRSYHHRVEDSGAEAYCRPNATQTCPRLIYIADAPVSSMVLMAWPSY